MTLFTAWTAHRYGLHSMSKPELLVLSAVVVGGDSTVLPTIQLWPLAADVAGFWLHRYCATVAAQNPDRVVRLLCMSAPIYRHWLALLEASHRLQMALSDDSDGQVSLFDRGQMLRNVQLLRVQASGIEVMLPSWDVPAGMGDRRTGEWLLECLGKDGSVARGQLSATQARVNQMPAAAANDDKGSVRELH